MCTIFIYIYLSLKFILFAYVGIFYTVAPIIEVCAFTYLASLSWNGIVFITFHALYMTSNGLTPPPLCSINFKGRYEDYPKIVVDMVQYESSLLGSPEVKYTVVLYLSR